MVFRSFADIDAWCDRTGYSGTELLTAAGIIALSRYENNPKISIDILYNGRNEPQKLSAVGNLLSGIPITLDLTGAGDVRGVLESVKQQYESGIREADYSFSVARVGPVSTERMRIIYEVGLDLPDNVPAGTVSIPLYDQVLQGNVSVLQVIVYVGNKEDRFTVMFVYNGALYAVESMQRLGGYFADVIKQLLTQ
jgi:hypothetical protein